MTAYLIACACWFAFVALATANMIAKDPSEDSATRWIRIAMLQVEVVMAGAAIALLMGKS